MSGPSTVSETNPAHVKLWVGNIPTKLTEYQLLKILDKFGSVSQYDFLYHISDTGRRTPRGYAFVTFSTMSSAEKAMEALNKTTVLGRELLVRLANPKTDPSGSSRKVIPAALKAGSKQTLSESEKARKIRDLEEKLKRMENSSKSEFKICSMPNNKSKPYDKK
jgi:RNA recognition motif-containing protein